MDLANNEFVHNLEMIKKHISFPVVVTFALSFDKITHPWKFRFII